MENPPPTPPLETAGTKILTSVEVMSFINGVENSSYILSNHT